MAGLALAAVAVLAYLGVDEFHTSRWQARWAHRWAREATWQVKPGASQAIRFPGPGPYDQRLGYSELPHFEQRLQARGYEIVSQASWSERMLALRDLGLYPPYHEKDQAGLDLTDCRGANLAVSRYPQRIYEHFEQVPALLVDSLLFVENRELLDTHWPTRNPAIEWDRFTKAALDQARRLVDDSHRSPGGSTLATQIEKYRHSPEGRTESGKEKLRQMASATLRAYLDSEDTRGVRHQIVVHYLDTVPLSAQPGYGEVNGLGDGLWVWYGRDFAEVNRLLQQAPGAAVTPGLAPAAAARSRHGRDARASHALPATKAGASAAHPARPASAIAATRAPVAAASAASTTAPTAVRPAPGGATAAGPTLLAAQALAYKQALSLMIAQRRPSYYLGDGEAALQQLTDSYLRVMADAGVIPQALAEAALPLPLKRRMQPPPEASTSYVGRKAANALRVHLSQVLGLPRVYELDRLDLQARSTLDGDVQGAARDLLRSLGDNAGAHAHGLYGFRLLSEGDDTSKLVLSFTLYERTSTANLLRVQTDNLDQPFDLNEGARLDLGSTAKLRTLVSYLEQVAQLHQQWSRLDRAALQALKPNPKDPIALWARDWLLQAGDDSSLKAMVDAALERTYSGDPGETFFTGGGAHHFVNFESTEDHEEFTVRKALWHSVNLVFIRLMRDVVHHEIYGSGDGGAALLADEHDPRRHAYLARFADQEGSEFLVRFYREYAGKTPAEVEQQLLHSLRATPSRLAAAFYGFEPQGSTADLGRFIAARTGKTPSDRELQTLQAKYGPDRWSLADRAYLAGIHPLALWVAGYLHANPKATLTQALAASHDARQDAYAWLFKTRHKDAQDVRIRELIEQDGFAKLLADWRRLGYPFDSITPSYATALGASGDRPAALADLMGIIVNHGLKLPTVRVGTLDFARGTPYETDLQAKSAAPVRLLPAEVADAARDAAQGVVSEGGTAGRLKGVFKRRDGTEVPVGGKTGTGDHRYDVYGRGGQLISSRVISRSGTFVFYIGDRYFGTMMVYAQEPYAARFKFTSALPAQLLKALAPTLLPLLDDQRTCPALAQDEAAARAALAAEHAASGVAATDVSASAASRAVAASAASAAAPAASNAASGAGAASAGAAASAAGRAAVGAAGASSAPASGSAASASSASSASAAQVAAAGHAASAAAATRASAASAAASGPRVPAVAASAAAAARHPNPPATSAAPAIASPAASTAASTAPSSTPHAAAASTHPSTAPRHAAAMHAAPASAATDATHAHAPNTHPALSPASAGSASGPPSSPRR